MNDVPHQNVRVLEAMRELANALQETTNVFSHYSPLRDRVLVLPLKQDDFHQVGSLVVPGGGRNQATQIVRVVSIGPGYQTRKGVMITPDVEPGDVVLVGRNLGEVIENGDIEYRLVKSGDILGIIIPGDASIE